MSLWGSIPRRFVSRVHRTFTSSWPCVAARSRPIGQGLLRGTTRVGKLGRNHASGRLDLIETSGTHPSDAAVCSAYASTSQYQYGRTAVAIIAVRHVLVMDMSTCGSYPHVRSYL